MLDIHDHCLEGYKLSFVVIVVGIFLCRYAIESVFSLEQEVDNKLKPFVSTPSNVRKLR
jgi:hypothetical protein